jgi:hypothetical protein
MFETLNIQSSAFDYKIRCHNINKINRRYIRKMLCFPAQAVTFFPHKAAHRSPPFFYLFFFLFTLMGGPHWQWAPPVISLLQIGSTGKGMGGRRLAPPYVEPLYAAQRGCMPARASISAPRRPAPPSVARATVCRPAMPSLPLAGRPTTPSPPLAGRPVQPSKHSRVKDLDRQKSHFI